MPTISVIVPVYNVEQYLDTCIDSILNQTFEDFELILVDDGSPDRCGEICDKYALKDSRIIVIHQKNGGLSAARNAGMMISKGSLLTFIDSDDVAAGDYFQVLYDLLKREDADISCCSMKGFVDNCEFEHNDDSRICFSGREAALNQYESGNKRIVSVSAWGKLYAKELFNGILFPEGKIHEDQAVVPIVLSRAKKVVACESALYGYRVRDNSITHLDFSTKRYDDIDAVDLCINYFEHLGDQQLATAAERRKDELIAFYSLLARKAGIFKMLPGKYRMSRIAAIKYLRDNLPYDVYESRVAAVYPVLISVEAHIRKLQKVLGLI